jgi:hypothetical protein
MESSTDLSNEIQEIKRKLSQPFATDYIQKHYPYLSPEPSYIQQTNCPDQLWQLVDENNLISWVFVSITLSETPLTDDILEDKGSLENASGRPTLKSDSQLRTQ